MMKLFILLLLIMSFNNDFPLKPKEEFEVLFELQFKRRLQNASGPSSNEDKPTTSGPLPYLFVQINLLKETPKAVKIRVSNDKDETLATKKIDSSLKLDLGFTDDIKDRISPHEYKVCFLSPDKKIIDGIIISFAEDGAYYVNGERRGKL